MHTQDRDMSHAFSRCWFGTMCLTFYAGLAISLRATNQIITLLSSTGAHAAISESARAESLRAIQKFIAYRKRLLVSGVAGVGLGWIAVDAFAFQWAVYLWMVCLFLTQVIHAAGDRSSLPP